MTNSRLFILGLSASWLAAAGCSLVNSFGDVVPLDAGTDSGAQMDSGGPDQTSPMPESGADTSSSTPDAPASDASHDATGPVDASTSDGSDGAPPPQGGAIAVGGNQSGDGGFVLSVLSPATGTELTREAMTVVGIHYDGLHDVWYLFENNAGLGGIFPAPGDPVNLHVRTLDTNTGVWTEAAKLRVPAIESTDTVAVLNGRLTYVAYTLNDAGNPTGGYSLILVDTTTPSAPTLVDPPTPLATLPTGTIGTRNLSGTGGTVNLFHVDPTACSDAATPLCPFEAVHVTVPSSGVPVVSTQTVTLGSVSSQGSEGVGSYLNGGPDDVVAFPPLGAASAFVERFSSATSLPVSMSTVDFGIANPHLQRLAVSECYGTAFVVGVPTDTQLYGVPLTTATSTVLTADTGHAGQAIAYEPYTNTVLAPFKANGSFAISAYAVSGTMSAPTLVNRTNTATWSPPADLEPNFVGVRQPIPFVCQ